MDTQTTNSKTWNSIGAKPTKTDPGTSKAAVPVPARQRNRASIACTSCRATRTKCFVDTGQNECEQCRRHGIECIIRDDDGRRRPASKVYTNSLLQRIETLESMLKQNNQNATTAQVTPPSQPHQTAPEQVQHPVVVQHASPLRPSCKKLEANDVAPVPAVLPEQEKEEQPLNVSVDCHSVAKKTHTSIMPIKSSQMVNNLLFLYNHLHTQSAPGRIRCFGPTTNMHLHLNNGPVPSIMRGECHWRIEMVLPDLSSATLDYLMGLYWTCHNSTIHLIHKDAFYEDEMSGKSQFYSTFLHFAMLSIGFRYADKARADIKQISLPGHESTLHKRAIKLVEYEMQSPGGLPSVQALFLLGDLECGCGRDDTGWMYAGMSLRLAFDIGLHLEPTQSNLKDRDVQIRYMVMWACIINDKYWSLFLGRPTSVKSDSVAVAKVHKDFDRLLSCRSVTCEKSMETKVYEALLDLMDIAGKITDILDTKDIFLGNDAYFKMAALDRDLHEWYSRLPQALKWTTRNVSTAPFSFYLLHQQYHTACILLHRPFADYGSARPIHDSDQPLDHITPTSTLSRNMCSHHAIRIARIFKEHQQRFDTRRIFVTGIQHAGTAATALIAEIAIAQNSRDRQEALEHLKCISLALQSMSETYQPAEEMSSIINQFIREYGYDLDGPSGLDTAERKPVDLQVREPSSWRVPDTGSRKRSHETLQLTDMFSDPTHSPRVKEKVQRREEPIGHSQSHAQDSLWASINLDMGTFPDHQDFLDFLDSKEETGMELDFLNAFDIAQ